MNINGVIRARQVGQTWGNCEHRKYSSDRCRRRVTYSLYWKERTERNQLITHNRYLCNAHTWDAAQMLVGRIE